MDDNAKLLSESIEPQQKSKFTIWDRIQFRYERFLTLRGSFIFLNLLFIFLLAYLFLLSLHTVFFDDTYILICFGEIHLLSGIDLISADHVYFVLFLLMLKQYTLFSADLSCERTVFSEPLIIKYPPVLYLHSPVVLWSICLY